MDKRKANSDGTAGKAFAVAGQGRSALRGIYDVLVDGKEPSSTFIAGTEVSVVFFALKSGLAVRIESIKRQGDRVEIRYMMLPHGLRVQKWKLAIVPLGKLPSGKYHVRTIRDMPAEEKAIQPGFFPFKAGKENRIVSQSFSFVVKVEP